MKYESQLQITTAAAVPPLTVNQTALVTNFNADLLDGQHGAYYATAASLGGYLPLTGGTLTGTLTGTVGIFTTLRATELTSLLGSNGPITITPDGTGHVHINSTDIRLGPNNTNATLATRGTGDLILRTNEGSAVEGSIRIYDGANGNIEITPNGTGTVVVGKLSGSTASFSGQITSTLASGTAPLVITSNTVVANLNSDFLDGQHGSFYQNAGNLNAGTLQAARLPAFSGGDVTSTAGTVALTLANSGVTAGTYTKVTVDAKGRVTTGALLASADLPTYTGTITSGQVTTALGFTPYNATNPSGYITSSATITGASGALTVNDTRSSVTGPSTGVRQVRADFLANSTDGLSDGGTYHGVLTFQQWADASGGGTRQLAFTDNDNMWLRGSGTALTAYGSWKLILNSVNYSTYALPLSGGTLTGQLFSNSKIETTGVVTGSSFSGAGTGLTGTAASLTAGAVPWTGVTGKPTTLAGYGITDALPLAGGTLSGLLTASAGITMTGGRLYVSSAASGQTYGGTVHIRDSEATGANNSFAGIAFSSAPGADFVIGKYSNAGVGRLQIRNHQATVLATIEADGSASFAGGLTATNFTGPGTGLTGTAAGLSIGGSAVQLNGQAASFYQNAGNLNAGTLLAARMPAFTGGDVTSTAGTVALTLANSGVTAGTYRSVTTDAKGRVTAGTNPTTLAGYGITDALDTSGTAQTKSGNLTVNSALTSGGAFYAATTVQYSNRQPIYTIYYGGGQDLAWKKIADITIGTGFYRGVTFKVDVVDNQGNFGFNSSCFTLTYFASCIRSAGVQDDFNNAVVTGPVADYVRVVKTATGVYELQIRQLADWQTYVFTVEATINSGGNTVTYASSTPPNGSTTGTIYTATPGWTSKLANIAVAGGGSFGGAGSFGGQITSTVATGTAPFVINSTTQVNNLNAQLLGGQLSTYYAAASSLTNYLPKSGGAMTGALALHSTGTNGFYNGTGDAATYALYNFKLGGWNGMALENLAPGGTYPSQVVGVINFREGTIDMKGGFKVNGASVITENQSITISGDASGTGKTAINLTLASVGTAGTYRSVTTDSKGRVTAGTNPTTLAGYGITDALPITGGALTGTISIDTSGSTALVSSVIIKRSGQSSVNFGQYSGAWRSALQIQSNSSDRLLFLAPPEADYQFGILRSANGGLKIDVGGTTANQGTNAVTIDTAGTANFPVGLQQNGNAVLTAATTSAPNLSIGGSAARWATGRTISLTGDVTGTSGAFDGTAALSFAATLANSGVGAGTYRSVTVNAKGLVTAGTNPTTLSGYGITDAMYQVDPNGFTQGDIYGSGNMQRLWGTDSVQNLIAFRPPTTVEYTVDGVNWVATTISNDVFDGKVFGKWSGFNMNVGSNIGAWTKVRMTWVNFGYHFFSHFTLCHSTNGHSMNFVFYKSDLSGVFSSEAYRVNGISSWPGYTFTSHVNVSGWWDTRDVRMVFELNGNNGPSGYPNNAISIGHIGIMGGYSSFNRVFDWDGNRNITLFGNLTLPGNVSATGTVSGSSFSGAGTNLTGTANSLNVGGYSARWATGRTIALTGDVTGTSGTFDGTAALSFGVTIANSAVTYAKIQNVATASVLGNSSASVAQAPAALSMATLAGMLSNQTMNINGSSASCTGNAATSTKSNSIVYPFLNTSLDLNTSGGSNELTAFNAYYPSGGAYNQPIAGAQHFRILQFGRYDSVDSNFWRGQMAMSFYEDRMWFRRENALTWQSWREFVHSGNVGSYALPIGGGTLNGNLTMGSGYQHRASDGSASAPGYSFSAETSTGIYRSGTNTLAFSTGGSQRVTINGVGAMNVTGAITQAGNQVLHAGNVSTYAFAKSGTWAADLVTSYGFTRETGMQMTGGSEFVVLSKSGQGYLLVDGSYIAAEAGGFYSTNNSSGGTLLGFYADTTASLNFNTTAVKLSSNQILHAGNYSSYAVDNTKRVKQFFWDSLGASTTQARRFEIARIAIDIVNWNQVGTFEIELHEQYYSKGIKKRYAVRYGYSGTRPGLTLVEMTGAGDNNFQVVLGSEQLVSGNHYYLPIYVDVRYYSFVDVRVTTSRQITTNSTPPVGYTYINSSPTPTNITDFTADSTVDISNAATAWQAGGNVILHAGNYTSYPPARWATGRTISLTGDVTGTSGTFDGTANLSFAATIANSSVTYAKIQNVTAYTVLGNSSASAAQAPVEIGMATLAGMLSNQTMNINGSAASVPWTGVTGKPTTLSGYGITNALPLTGGTLTGVLSIQASSDNQLLLQGTDTWAGIGFRDSANVTDYIWYWGATQTFAIGGGGSAGVSGKKLHIDGGVTIGSSYDAVSMPTNGLNVEGAIQQAGNQVLHAGNYATSYLNGTYLRAAGHPGYGDWNTFGNTAQTVHQMFQENFNLPTSTGSSNFPTNASYKYGTLINFGTGADARAQVYISHAGNDLVFRGGWGTAGWNTWNRCVTDVNFPSFGTHQASIGNSLPTTVFMSTDANIRQAPFATAKAHLGITSKWANSRPNNTADTNYWTGAMGWGTTDWNSAFDWGSGFADSWGGPANNPGDTSHHLAVQAVHYTNGSGRYGWQMVNGAGTNRWWLRDVWGGGFSSWREVIHSGNYTSYSPSLTGGGASGTWGINITGSAGSVAASGITGQTGMWTSAARPGPYRLYRRDADDGYSVQTYWTGSRWRLYGYNADTAHADTHVGYADSAGSASSASSATNSTQLNGQAASYYENRDTTAVGISAGTLTLTRAAGNLTTTIGGRVVAWCEFNGNFASTGSPNAAFNVSSITKNATGDYTINFTSALANTNYVVAGYARVDTTNNTTNYNLYIGVARRSTAKTTTSCRIGCEWVNSTLFDAESVGVAFIAA